MSQQFLIVAIVLLPLQSLSLFLMGSRYDLSPFVLLTLAVLLLIRHGIRGRSAVALLAFIAVHVTLMAWFGVAPGYRVFSGVVWLGGLLYFLLEGSQVRYRPETVARTLLGVLTLSAIHVFGQAIVGTADRPKGTFHEPSFAGLCLYAAAVALLVSLILVRRPARLQVPLYGLVLLLFGAALLTFSMHIVTFVVTLVAVASFLWLPSLLTFPARRRLGLRAVLLLLVFGGAVAAVVVQLTRTEHFSQRLAFANPSNFSLLSWLRGLDQTLAAVRRSFAFGMGLGSTGFFPFQSAYSDILTALGKPELNLTDAYSLAFRLVIEIGLPLLLIFLGYLVVRLRALTRFVRADAGDGVGEAARRGAVTFNVVFAIAVIAGCLLKEPLYPQSFLYVAVVLVASAPLGVADGAPASVEPHDAPSPLPIPATP